jgi:hypothetical protein
MHTDRYTKTVLTVIAAALTAIALSPWATAGGWIDALRPQGAEAQDCPTTAGDLSVAKTNGRLAAVAATGHFIFEGNDAIWILNTIPNPTNPRCQWIKIRRS